MEPRSQRYIKSEMAVCRVHEVLCKPGSKYGRGCWSSNILKVLGAWFTFHHRSSYVPWGPETCVPYPLCGTHHPRGPVSPTPFAAHITPEDRGHMSPRPCTFAPAHRLITFPGRPRQSSPKSSGADISVLRKFSRRVFYIADGIYTIHSLVREDPGVPQVLEVICF